MAASGFKVNRRDIEFTLFEHFKVQELFKLDYFKEHSQETYADTLSTAISISESVLAPLNKIADKQGCVYDKETKSVKTPPGTKEAYRTYIENGFFAFCADEAQDGLQGPLCLQIALLEVFSGANIAFTMYPGLSQSAANVLIRYGNEWMKSICVAKIFSGEWSGTMCLTEPSVGSAVGDLLSTAKRTSDDPKKFHIKGTKQWISGGEQDITSNIIHLVLARIEGAPKGSDGISLFVVPKFRFDKKTGALGERNDMMCISIEEKLGLHGNSTSLLQFGDAGECEGYLLGEENEGLQYMFLMMNEARIAVAIQGLSQASVAFLGAEAYAKERIQGVDLSTKKDALQTAKRVSIIEHPDVKRMLLRQRSVVEAMRAICYMAGLYCDQGARLPNLEERKMAHAFLELLTPIAKAWCSDMGFASIVQSIQTYGGYGFTKDYPVEQILRDTKITSIYEGTNGIQSLDLVGRKLKMEEGMVFVKFLERFGNLSETLKANDSYKEEGAFLEKCIGSLMESAMAIGAFSKTDRKRAVLNSYPFLMAFGHVVGAGLLLEQALISEEKLKGTVSNADKVFYKNKTRTARFFTHNVLPECLSQLSIVKKGELSCMEFEF